MSNSTNELVTNTVVVIRSVGERTEELCIKLAEQQVPKSRVVVIHEQPFSQAVHKSFEVGLDFGLDWTMTLDADVLLRPNAIRILVTLAEDLTEEFFEIEAYHLDKLMGHPLPGGAHLFRTSLLEEALNCVSHSEAILRPETHVKEQMKIRGYPRHEEPVTICLHDYEQYYRDIYRKAFVHAHKHSPRIVYAKRMWQRLAEQDSDYQVALLGLGAGQMFEGTVSIDRSQFPEEISGLLRAHGLEEKDALISSALTPTELEDIINRYAPPPEYIEWQNDEAQKKMMRIARKSTVRSLGPARYLLWALGQTLKLVGRKLELAAEKHPKL